MRRPLFRVTLSMPHLTCGNPPTGKAGLPWGIIGLPLKARRVLQWMVFAALLLPGVREGMAVTTDKVVRLFGVDYIDARAFGPRFGLSPRWTEPQKKLRLQSEWTTIDFAAHRREVWLNGVCLFLSEPVVPREGTLWLGQRDADTLLAAVLVPQRVRPPRAVKTIVIDPGHGGNDPGKQNSRLRLNEKALTLDVARRLERLLKRDGFRVVLTRRSDQRVELEERAAIARRARADVFVSIHFNGFSDRTVAGAETFVLTPHRQRSSPAAEKDKTMMATRYAGNAHDHWNAVLGYHMHRQLTRGLQLEDRGLKRFRYLVLREVNCPAVLVEAAFLSNDAEARRVGSAAYRQRLAESLLAGLRNHAAAVAKARAAKP